ncbi:phosphatase PAP2 family protein [Microvirga sp. W0021]|uniref:Phosphatase PAP2 family protein n=1 Tax=Hohaiivirga grylli TaxID=3133970 RepID=A0ABV0BIR5_9HYPH
MDYNMLEALNPSWFLSLNATPDTAHSVLVFARFCAKYLVFIIPITLLYLWCFRGSLGRIQAMFCLATILMAMGIAEIVQLFYFHPRPFMVPLGHSWLHHAPNTSFPSHHGTFFFSAAIALLVAHVRGAGYLVLATALIVAWSRVFLGVHFPLDMVGALIVSVVACILVVPLWRRWGDRLTTICETIYFRFLPYRFR